MLDDELFSLAAAGDMGAVVELSQRAMGSYFNGVPEAIGGAEVLYRLAAAKEPALRTGLAGFLLGRGTFLKLEGQAERGEALRHEAVAILKDVVMSGHPDAIATLVMALQCLADEGDEPAAVELNTLMDALSPETAEQVRSGVAGAMKELDALTAG